MKPLTIVALGDSTTAGTPRFQSPAEFPPDGRGDIESSYTYWLAQNHLEWKVINRGVNGERTDQILKRFETDVLDYHPDIVIILAGVNDLYQGASLAQVQQNLESLYAKGLNAGFKVMVCTVLPFNRATPEVNTKMELLNHWIRETSEKKSLGFCDTHKALEDPLRPGKLLSTEDQLHPDKAGYRKMGEAVTRCLEQWLEPAPYVERLTRKF